MSTSQNYSAQSSGATTVEPTARKAVQPSNAEIALLVNVTSYSEQASDAELIYWALEGYKDEALKRTKNSNGPGSDGFEGGLHEAARVQDIQNSLVDSIFGLCSILAKSAQ